MTFSDEYRRRLATAGERLAQAGEAALVATPGADLRYLCGLDAHASERLTALVVRADGESVLIAPALERSSALASPAGELGIEVLSWSETENPYAIVAGLLPDGEVLLSDRTWAQHLFGLRDIGVTALTSGASLMSGLRAVKSPDEIASLRAAAHAIDSVHDAIDQWLCSGRTETEVAADLTDAIRAAGHSRVDFVIVGSGLHGARPHHTASDRVIEPGDMVVVDIGGTMPDGYCSDSTRTYAVGDAPGARAAEVYAVVATAQQAARDAVAPGVSAESIDTAARQVIVDAGYGPQFVHRTGHGIGMEGHEPPYIVAGNHDPLPVGAAFSIEPGIYLDGDFGVRIEDIVVVTDAGVDVLNETTRELRVIG